MATEECWYLKRSKLNRYRSKYRNRRRTSSSSSSSSSSDDGGKVAKPNAVNDPPKISNDEFVEPPLFHAVEVVKEDRESVRPPSPKPVKQYYGRRQQKSESELSDSEPEAVTIKYVL